MSHLRIVAPSVFACLSLLASPARAQPPNVLILVADDVGLDKVGVYGGPAPPPTPNIDGLARRGVRFNNAWANPLCAPTRACIMTGRYSVRTGVGAAKLSQGGVLRYPETTIPELLDREGSGYTHAAIGKWHLSDKRNGGDLGPNLAGWSHYAGTLLGVAPSYYVWQRTENGVTQTSYTYNTTQTVDDALTWIDTTSEPWVCYVAFQAAHHPLHQPPSHLHSYDLSGEPPPIAYYKAMVEAMDTEIGRLLAGLGARLADTNVLFMGDNGTSTGLAEPAVVTGRGKGSFYQAGVTVPLIVAGPDVVGADRQVDALVSAVDVFATVAELCRVDPATDYGVLDAISLVPYLRDPAQRALRTTIYAELFQGPPTTTAAVVAMRNDRYKLIRSIWSPALDEFYDLSLDPYELNNLLIGGLTPQQEALRQSFAQEINAIRYPTPALRNYGSASCLSSIGAVRATALGEPRLNASYQVEILDAAPFQPAWLSVGGSATQWEGHALPLFLSALGSGPGCAVWSSIDAQLGTVTGASGHAILTIPVPNEPLLVGGSLYHSWLALDPDAPHNPVGLVSSDGVVVTVAW
ncbi:MAG: sulfatase-like hydrolase/transferase [Planctomycetota bacterium]